MVRILFKGLAFALMILGLGGIFDRAIWGGGPLPLILLVAGIVLLPFTLSAKEIKRKEYNRGLKQGPN